MLKSLGLVWIPGVMAGMMASGANPVYAGIYQFVVVAMILAASAITALFITLFVRSQAFSPAAQLILHPQDSAGSITPPCRQAARKIEMPK
jgi:putative ABC transport system permease protein